AALGVVLAVVGLTWYASRRQVLRETRLIIAAARAVVAGDHAARVGAPYRSGELGALAQTFDRMLDEVARHERDLQEREEWFRSVVQQSTDMIAIVDRNGRLTYLSPAVERILGTQPERLVGQSVIELVHPDEQTRFGEIFKYLAAQPNRVAAVEHRLRHAEGHYVFMESIGVNLLGNRAVQGIVVNSRDVTRRRRIEEMLRLVTSAVDQSLDGVLIATAAEPTPQIVYVNPALVGLTGYQEIELIGATPAIVGGVGAADTMLERLASCLATGEDRSFEIAAKAKDGRPYPMAVQAVPLKDDNGRITHFVAICRDVTDERRAEAERERLETTLRQALKMEAVGTLAGGIAHDFNNVLLPMMMLTQLTLNRLAPDSRERMDLARVFAAQKRAKALVGQILAFSRGSSGEYVDVDLAAICRETLHLLRATLPSTVSLVDQVAAVGRVRADPTQVQQVVMNLCGNAAQAMPSGKGTITVRLDEVSLDYAELLEFRPASSSASSIRSSPPRRSASAPGSACRWSTASSRPIMARSRSTPRSAVAPLSPSCCRWRPTSRQPPATPRGCPRRPSGRGEPRERGAPDLGKSWHEIC
ncbi:MAG: PAS domain S-box protein, partial [Proteobacteria bacterium]|nr:PAS domain S-box protein [Pseudomonadota bacterium]